MVIRTKFTLIPVKIYSSAGLLVERLQDILDGTSRRNVAISVHDGEKFQACGVEAEPGYSSA